MKLYSKTKCTFFSEHGVVTCSVTFCVICLVSLKTLLMAFIFACNICTLVKYRGITYILTVCPICLGVLHCVFTDFFCSVDGLYHMISDRAAYAALACLCLSVSVSVTSRCQYLDNSTR